MIEITIDVPHVPGVPDLIAYATGGFEEDLMTEDTVEGWGTKLTPVWGLYKGGVPVIFSEAVVAFSHRREWNISNYPIERGGFESYNRVNQPFMCRLQFAAGSDMAARQALLNSLAVATADGNLTKYDVVTPEVIYSSVNVQSFDYDRKAMSGAKLLLIDVTVVEIREQNAPAADSKSPAGVSTAPGGNVQSQDVPQTAPAPADPNFAVT